MMMNLGFLRGLNINNMNLTSIQIEKKLNNPETKLEDLLIEEEIIQEFRNSNEKLMKFFNKEKIKELVNYIISEPIEDDQIKGHKFPFVASEILNCEEKNIYNYFLFTESELEKEQEKENEHINLNSSHEMKDVLDDKVIANDENENNDEDNNEKEREENKDKMDIDSLEPEKKENEENKEKKDENKENKDENKETEEKKEENKENEKKEVTEEKKEEKKE